MHRFGPAPAPAPAPTSVLFRAESILILLALGAGSAADLRGQDPSQPALFDACEDAVLRGDIPSALLSHCADVAATLELLQPELGIALVAGNPVLGTASPIGTRFRGIPRFHLGPRLTFAFADVPDVIDYPGSTSEPLATRSFVLPAARLDLSVGVFEGRNLTATLGGFGAVEILGSLGVLILPSGEGFRSNSTILGLGARIGLLRESFTAPGISLTGSYRWTGRLDYGAAAGGDDSELGLDLGAWSFRAGVSKSFQFLALTVSGGYDDYQSEVHMGLVDPGSGALLPVIERSDPASLGSGRWSVSADVAYVVLYFSAVAELGWQEGRAVLTSRGGEVESGKFFAGLGLRISL